MARSIEFSIGEFYHLYNRGNDKRVIFSDESDYARFVTLLYLANSTKPFHMGDYRGSTSVGFSSDRGGSLVDIGAYCLMPNHFHILTHERVENGISMFMQKISTGYTMYFNKKYDRTGALFGGRFKATHADSDKYLNYLFAYIHLNPVKLVDPEWKENGIKNKLKSEQHLLRYQYSSYLDYCGDNRKEKVIINSHAFPEYFEKQHSFRDFISYWLDFNSPQAPEVEPRGVIIR